MWDSVSRLRAFGKTSYQRVTRRSFERIVLYMWCSSHITYIYVYRCIECYSKWAAPRVSMTHGIQRVTWLSLLCVYRYKWYSTWAVSRVSYSSFMTYSSFITCISRVSWIHVTQLMCCITCINDTNHELSHVKRWIACVNDRRDTAHLL